MAGPTTDKEAANQSRLQELEQLLAAATRRAEEAEARVAALEQPPLPQPEACETDGRGEPFQRRRGGRGGLLGVRRAALAAAEWSTAHGKRLTASAVDHARAAVLGGRTLRAGRLAISWLQRTGMRSLEVMRRSALGVRVAFSDGTWREWPAWSASALGSHLTSASIQFASMASRHLRDAAWARHIAAAAAPLEPHLCHAARAAGGAFSAASGLTRRGWKAAQRVAHAARRSRQKAHASAQTRQRTRQATREERRAAEERAAQMSAEERELRETQVVCDVG